MGLQDFESLLKLGEGSYSKVYKVIRLADGSEYAMKKVSLGEISQTEKQNALNEVRILASIESPFVISYREAFIQEDSLYIVMEYAPGGDLKNAIRKRAERRDRFKEQQVWQLLYEVVRGLKTLHERKVIHCDMKSANVFLTGSGSKLADMNVSKVTKNGLIYTQTGTPYYAAPEVWRDQPFDNRSDIWSLGIIIYEMVSFELPFKGDSMEELAKAVNSGKYKKLPEHYSAELRTLVSNLLQVDPASRPSCDDILKHPRFRNFIQEPLAQNPVLLQTIKLDDFKLLKDVLPKPKYGDRSQSKDTPETRKTGRKDVSSPFSKPQSKLTREITTRHNSPSSPTSGAVTKRASQRCFQQPALYSDYRHNKYSTDRGSIQKCISTNQIKPKPSHRLQHIEYSPSYQRIRPQPREYWQEDHRVSQYHRLQPSKQRSSQRRERGSFISYQSQRHPKKTSQLKRDSDCLRREPSVESYRNVRRLLHQQSKERSPYGSNLLCTGLKSVYSSKRYL